MGSPKQSAGLRELVACLVVSVALFTWSCQSGGSGPLAAIRGVFQTVTMPVTYLGAAVSSPLRGLGNIFANLTADQATLTELEAAPSEPVICQWQKIVPAMDGLCSITSALPAVDDDSDVASAYAWGDEDDEHEHVDDLEELDEDELAEQEPFLLFE